jgi:hypothetical protein
MKLPGIRLSCMPPAAFVKISKDIPRYFAVTTGKTTLRQECPS